MNRVEPRHVLLVCAGIYGFLGLWGLLSPEGMVALIGVKPEGIDGIGDIRAMYGGLELALAGLLLWHAMDEDRVSAGLILAGVTVGGIGGGRLFSQLLTGFSPLSAGLCLVELGSAILCGWFSQQR